MTGQPILIRPQPGIQRDGTLLDATGWVDGRWTRFQRGLPRKMRGVRSMTNDMSGIVRGIEIYSRGGERIVHAGSPAAVDTLLIDRFGNASASYPRTPATLANHIDNMWSFDTIYDPIINNSAAIIAHVAPNAIDIDSDDPGTIYYGPVGGAGALAPLVTAPPVSGGVLSLHPYLLAFGSNGYVAATIPNNPDGFLGVGSFEGNVTDQKIVYGHSFRGGGQSPSGLLWSLNALIRVSYSGGAAIWAFDTISDQISIMSSRAVTEADGMFFWMGTDKFFVFNGVVRELPNENNVNDVFDNINYAYRQRAFSFRNSRWGEIWWCYPRGNATECTHAVVYNYRENSWYDTELLSPRSCGVAVDVFPYPILGGVDQITASGKYKLWQHEVGVDEIDGNLIKPIRAYIESSPVSLLLGEQPGVQHANIQLLEPDFLQTGDMKLYVTGRMNGHAPDVTGEVHTIYPPPQPGDKQIVRLRETRRQMRLIFESNTVGGDFQFGKVFAHIEPTDGRIST